MNLHLVDRNLDVVEAWSQSFVAHPEVIVEQGSILDIANEAVVSPANSHGFMDGGIDLAYMRHFGHQLQDRVREMVYRRPEQMLPVGSAELVHTRNASIPWLIVAPTMEMPEAVLPMNARRALAAVLRLADRHPEITDIFCPGLCTGVGQVSPLDSAEAMAQAYSDWNCSQSR